MAQQDKSAEQHQQQQSAIPAARPEARAEETAKLPQQNGKPFTDWAAI